MQWILYIFAAISFVFLGKKYASHYTKTAIYFPFLEKTKWHHVFANAAETRGEVAFRRDPKTDELMFSSNPAIQLLDFAGPMAHEGEELLRNLVPPSDQDILSDILQHLREGKSLDRSLRFSRANGSTMWIQVLIFTLEGGNCYGIMRSVQDLYDERDRLEEKRRHQTIATLSGGLAHEFNNHLTPIQGFIELALDALGPDHPVSAGLRTAEERAEHCSQLVKRIQSFGGNQILKKERIDLSHFLPVTIRVATSSFSEVRGRIAFIRKWKYPLPMVLMDASHINEAITELLQNAVRAIDEEGSISITCEQIDDPETGTMAVIRIQDTGCGIPPENRSRVFDPFFTTHQSVEARGMGLTMVQGIVKHHSGRIELAHPIEGGTEVSLYLPTVREEASVDLPADEDTLNVMPAANAGRMLVADDEGSILQLIRRTFETDGWDVETVSDYTEVLRHVVEDKTEFDILICDITMPGPSASDALRQIKQTYPNMPVLLISGYSRDQHIESLLQDGQVHFLPKPFTVRKILEKVDQILSASA